MKKRWLSLYVVNGTGVLAKISCLFAGKNYNLDSLTVGTTNDTAVSRMTISLTSDERLFEQIKKQLNRCVDIIKVVDLTDLDILVRELLFVKIHTGSDTEQEQIMKAASRFAPRIHAAGRTILFELTASCEENEQFISLLSGFGEIEVLRSGAVAVEKDKE